MDKLFIDRDGEVDEFFGSRWNRKRLRFPVCLSVRYKDEEVETCSNFVMNVVQGGLLVKLERPLKTGARLKMRFYVPDADMLLGEFEGEVTGINPHLENCVQIRLVDPPKEDLKKLMEFLEEKRHLIDEEA